MYLKYDLLEVLLVGRLQDDVRLLFKRAMVLCMERTNLTSFVGASLWSSVISEKF